MRARRRSRSVWLLFLLALPLLLGGRRAKWIKLAEHDLSFPRGLVAEGIRYGPRFMQDIIDGVVCGCEPPPSKLIGLTDSRIRLLTLYSEYCYPWSDAWAGELWPCELDRLAPKWCKSGNEDLAGKHIRIEPYFETLTAAMNTTDDALLRYNIMAVIVDRLGYEDFRDYPKASLATPVATATSAFLAKASPEEALSIGWFLNIEPFGEYPSLGPLFRDFRDRTPTVTEEQHRLLGEIANALENKPYSDDARSTLNERYARRPYSPPPPPPVRTDPDDIALLIKRVDAFYRLMQERKFAESWDMLGMDYRWEREGYVRTHKSIWRHSELVDTRVVRILIKGNNARVYLEQRGRSNHKDGLSFSTEGLRHDYSFWVFENGTWYKVPWPKERLDCYTSRPWRDEDAVEVPVPATSREQ